MKKITGILLLFGMTCFFSTAARADNPKLSIHDVLHVQDIYENQVSAQLSVKEIVTEINEDGTFDTQPVGDWLEENTAYESLDFKTEDLEKITVYYRADSDETSEESQNAFSGKLSVGDIVRICDIDRIEDEAWISVEEVIAVNDKGDIITQNVVFLGDDDMKDFELKK